MYIFGAICPAEGKVAGLILSCCNTEATKLHLPLPPKCPELNPVENVWEFMRDNWLSNRIFTCYKNIVDHCCDAWNKLEAQPWRIMTLGLRDWANGLWS